MVFIIFIHSWALLFKYHEKFTIHLLTARIKKGKLINGASVADGARSSWTQSENTALYIKRLHVR